MYHYFCVALAIKQGGYASDIGKINPVFRSNETENNVVDL